MSKKTPEEIQEDKDRFAKEQAEQERQDEEARKKEWGK